MIKENENLEIILPKNQLHLFGYEYYFNSFINLYQKNKLPNTILLSGPEGSGKATFAYHFINYLLSHNEKNEYSVENFTINPDNKSYKNLCNNTHPNFSLL
jgi:DNA polymerase-3 subunit delta'